MKIVKIIFHKDALSIIMKTKEDSQSSISSLIIPHVLDFNKDQRVLFRIQRDSRKRRQRESYKMILK
jgi:hypothetical protein